MNVRYAKAGVTLYEKEKFKRAWYIDCASALQADEACLSHAARSKFKVSYNGP